MKPVSPVVAPTRIRLESLGQVEAEIHRIRAADGVEIALTRLTSALRDGHGVPVVMVHGSYSDRRFCS